jgi:hypothetical protein
MKHLQTFVFLLAMCMGSGLDSFAHETNLKDSSPLGSPLALSGTILFTDDGSQEIPYSLEVHAAAKNISARRVLLFKVSLETLSDGAPSGPHEYTNDYYFSSELFEPDSVIKIPFDFPRFGPRISLDHAPRISASARVEFVQFEDGTAWGDSNSGKEALRIRTLTLHELNVLKDKYAEAGDTGFSETLVSASRTLPAVTTLQHIYKKDGLEKAEASAWRMLTSANEHAGGLKAVDLTSLFTADLLKYAVSAARSGDQNLGAG